MNGFLNVNKPSGMSSSQVVSKIKYALHLKKDKIGHMGTLDPMASGVLPIAVGRATRLFDYLLKKRKIYIADFKFGELTDTLDAMGDIIQTSDKIPSYDDIKQSLNNFLGEIDQIPPQYSAKSVNGQRAYKVARNGGEVELKPCKVSIYDFRILEQKNDNTYSFIIECSAGTYIRSLCRDLALQLNTVATMITLKRIKSGIFDIKESIDLLDVSLDELLPTEYVLTDLARIDCSQEQIKTLLDGKNVNIDIQDGQYRFYLDNELQGICNILDRKIIIQTWLR